MIKTMTQEQFIRSYRYLRLSFIVEDMRVKLLNASAEMEEALRTLPELEAKMIIKRAKQDPDLLDTIQKRACMEGLSDSLFFTVLRHIKSIEETIEHEPANEEYTKFLRKSPDYTENDQKEELKDLPTSKDMPVKVEAPLPVNVKKTETFSYRHEEFSFEEHIKQYEEKVRKGKIKSEIISSFLEDNKEAQSYFEYTFEVTDVEWDVRKLIVHLKSSIEWYKDKRQKYGDGGLTNYSESIRRNEFILRRLEDEDEELNRRLQAVV